MQRALLIWVWRTKHVLRSQQCTELRTSGLGSLVPKRHGLRIESISPLHSVRYRICAGFCHILRINNGIQIQLSKMAGLKRYG